jgi:hypothetical protein
MSSGKTEKAFRRRQRMIVDENARVVIEELREALERAGRGDVSHKPADILVFIRAAHRYLALVELRPSADEEAANG